jgi:hypothetical protein
MRLGTSLVLELIAREVIKPTDDPWPTIDLILRGKSDATPKRPTSPDIKAVANTWALGCRTNGARWLRLLSRMSLSAAQAKPLARSELGARMRRGSPSRTRRSSPIPYRIAECDIGDLTRTTQSLWPPMDRGVMPDAARFAHFIPWRSRRASNHRWTVKARTGGTGQLFCAPRRLAGRRTVVRSRGAPVALGKLALAQPVRGAAWTGSMAMQKRCWPKRYPGMRLVLNHETDEAVQCLQLKELQEQGGPPRQTAKWSRAAATLPSTGEAWQELIRRGAEGERHQFRILK